MAENIYEVMKSNHPDLVTRVIDKSEEISKFLMLVYSHLLYAAMDQRGDPKDIVLTYNIIEGTVPLLKIDMKYYESEGVRLGDVEGKNPIKRNLNLVRLVNSNSNVRDFPVRLVDILERWINEKPYRKEFGLAAIKFENAMFWKNLVFTAELILNIEWEEMVKAKTKFFDEDELANEHPMVQGGYLV